MYNHSLKATFYLETKKTSGSHIRRFCLVRPVRFSSQLQHKPPPCDEVMVHPLTPTSLDFNNLYCSARWKLRNSYTSEVLKAVPMKMIPVTWDMTNVSEQLAISVFTVVYVTWTYNFCMCSFKSTDSRNLQQILQLAVFTESSRIHKSPSHTSLTSSLKRVWKFDLRSVRENQKSPCWNKKKSAWTKQSDVVS